MYLTVKQHLKHLSKSDYRTLRELCHYAKNLTNEAVYHARQQYFASGGRLGYEKSYSILKTSPNYRALNSNMAQQILKEADGAFKSFFSLLKSDMAESARLPHYLPKDGFATLVIGFVRLNGNMFCIPFSNHYKKHHPPVIIEVPEILRGKAIKEIRIIPKADARFFEVHYCYEEECAPEKVSSHVLALDLGVDNLITAVSDTGRSFIVDGRRLKSINQGYNKYNAHLQSIKDHQRYPGRKSTVRQKLLAVKRNNRVCDYMNKAACIVVRYCLANDIGILVCGYNHDFQRNSDLGSRNNQVFVNIPFGKLMAKLEYLCMPHGISFMRQEESYTSKSSFWDHDPIPVYGSVKDGTGYSFSGQRVKRGLYRTGDGRLLNADVNGALNIMRKSNVVDLSVLYSRGVVDTPVRIRVL